MSSSKSASPPFGGNFVQNFVSDNIIKYLDDEFAKFESAAKDCDRYTVLDVKLPTRIIELFYRLFKLCVNNKVLRQNVDNVELFAKIFLTMRTEFKAQCPCGLEVADVDEDTDDDDDDCSEWGECCESDPLQRFLHYINHKEVKEKREAKKKAYKELKDAEDWLVEQDDFLICEICNTKFVKCFDLMLHGGATGHTKNLEIFKENNVYIAFPDPDNETYGCKVCKSEYSTLNSLIKHFTKPQHEDTKKKFLTDARKAKPDAKKSSNKETKPTPSANNVVMTFKGNQANDTSKPTDVVNGIKIGATKTVANLPIIKTVPGDKSLIHVVPKETPKSVDNAAVKSKAKSAVDVAPKPKPADNVSQSKNTPNVAPKAQPKPSDTTSAKPTAESTPNNANSAKKPTKQANGTKFIVSKDSTHKYCQICAQILPNEAAVLAHIKEAAHLKMVSTFESNQEYIKMSICGTEFFCIMCAAKSSSLHDLALHFNKKEHLRLTKSAKISPAPPAPAKPVQKPVQKPIQKPVVKNILNNAKLRDSDKKFLRQKATQATCIVCNTTLNSTDDVVDHVNGKKHAQTVLDFIQHEQYVQLPADKITSFNCLKCTSVFDSFDAILTHCKAHIDSTPKPKAVEPFKLKKSDEKFISKGKSEKSSKCSLCDKELPTEAALISHTGSSNHLKNYNTFTKNETYYVAGKNSCSLCEIACNDLASLVKHFKTDTHQKTTVKGKKPQNQPSIHIPSYSKAKLDQMEVPIVLEKSSPKGATPKKDKKSDDGRVRKSRLQLFSMNEQNFDEITFDQFPMKKPDNSYVIAKNDIFYCRICDADLPAAAVASHMNGATHRINAEVYESLQCHVSSSSDGVQCTSCKLTFDHVHHLIKHFREKIHAKPTPNEKPSDPEPVFDLTSTDLAEKITLNPKDSKPSKSNGSPKRLKIPKSDRQHIFRLTGTIVQCSLCNMKLCDNESLESHINNLNHKRNSALFRENETLIRQLDSVGGTFECIPCTFTGDLNKVIKHCKKKQHATAKGCEDDGIFSEDEVLDDDPEDEPLLSEFDLKCINMKNGIVRCKLCHSKLNGERNLLEHMNSPNHKNYSAIYKLNEPFIEQFDELGYSYKCTVCEVIFTRLDTMIRHFSEPGHDQPADETKPLLVTNDRVKLNVKTYIFECILCSNTFEGFANLSKHCHSPQHEVLKNTIQSVQNEIPYNITITDYQYHCNACNIRLLNKALMEKHQKKRIHVESANFFAAEAGYGEHRPSVIEIVGYEYLCNLCWFPMYSAAELAVHEQSSMHKSGRDFDDVWRFNEKHLIMCENMYKVRCKLCEKTIGIEKFIKHCTSRDHRMRFIASHLEESAQDQHIVWRNATQYCTLCDCKLINNHNLVNHVNSEKHKLKLLQN